MVAELVETSRLWGRTAARIEPLWIEPLAGHLVKRQYSEPHWERKRASVVATERVTLFGLPIVTDRKIAYGKIDPVVARELFIRSALVEGDWDTKHAFFDENRSLLEEAEELEERARRRDIVVSDGALFDFYDERIPADVVSGAHFDKWYRDVDPALLVFPRSLLVTEAAEELDPRDWPSGWRQGDQVLRLSYAFEPGAEHDGVTVHVPLTALTALRPDGFEWLVPGLRAELVETLLRGLPKDVRRRLVPMPDVAAELMEVVEPRRAPIQVALARGLERVRGVQVSPSDFDLAALPPHLRTMFRVEDADGTVVAEGYDLRALRGDAAPRLRRELASQTSGLERTGLTSWTIGTLPRTVEAAGVTAYPALADEGATVGVRVLETAAAQAASQWAGTRRLILLSVPSPVRWVTGQLGNSAQLALAGMPEVLDDATVAAADVLIAAAGGPAWDAAGLRRAARRRRPANWPSGRWRWCATSSPYSTRRGRCGWRWIRRRQPELQEARLDVARQLGGLVYPGFVAATGAARLPDLVRYLAAAERRLERLPSAPAQDRDRMTVVNELEERVPRAARRAARSRARGALDAGGAARVAVRAGARREGLGVGEADTPGAGGGRLAAAGRTLHARREQEGPSPFLAPSRCGAARQRHRDHRAAVIRRAHRAAVREHYPLDYREPEAGAAAARAVGRHERFEDAVEQLRRDAGPVVGDRDDDLVALGAHVHVYARVGVADGVVDQVGQDPEQPLGVPGDDGVPSR